MASSSRTKVTLFGAGGVLTGVLAAVEGVLQPVSSHASATSTTEGGLLVVVLSVLGTIAAHFGLSQRDITVATDDVESKAPQVLAVASQLPGFSAAVADAKKAAADAQTRVAAVEARVNGLLATVPAPAQDEVRKAAMDLLTSLSNDVKTVPAPVASAPVATPVPQVVPVVSASGEPAGFDANGNPIPRS